MMDLDNPGHGSKNTEYGYLYMNEQELNYSKGTISISLVHEALLSAQHQGLNTQNILIKSGIPVELLHLSLIHI